MVKANIADPTWQGQQSLFSPDEKTVAFGNTNLHNDNYTKTRGFFFLENFDIDILKRVGELTGEKKANFNADYRDNESKHKAEGFVSE